MRRRRARVKRLMRKAHNFMLWVTAGVMFMVFLISVAAADSDSLWFAVSAVVSLGWLLLFALANEERWER